MNVYSVYSRISVVIFLFGVWDVAKKKKKSWLFVSKISPLLSPVFLIFFSLPILFIFMVGICGLRRGVYDSRHGDYGWDGMRFDSMGIWDGVAIYTFKKFKSCCSSYSAEVKLIGIHWRRGEIRNLVVEWGDVFCFFYIEGNEGIRYDMF